MHGLQKASLGDMSGQGLLVERETESHLLSFTSFSGVGDDVTELREPFLEPWMSTGMETGRSH